MRCGGVFGPRRRKADFRLECVPDLPSLSTGGHRSRRRKDAGLGGRLARHADLLDVAMIGAAAAAEHVDLRVAPQDLAVLGTELRGIAIVEIGSVVELLVAPWRRIGADGADTLGPQYLLRHGVFDMCWAGAVDQIVGRRSSGRRIDLRDGLTRWTTGVMSPRTPPVPNAALGSAFSYPTF